MPPADGSASTDGPRPASGRPLHEVSTVNTWRLPSWCHANGLLLSIRPGSVSRGAGANRTDGRADA
jgi:hypothetical protein